MPPIRPRPAVNVALLSEPLLGRLVALLLGHIDAECRPAKNEGGLRDLIKSWTPDLVIADLDRYPDAPTWTMSAKTLAPAVACIGLTRKRGTPAKLEAFDKGAYDVIEVPFTADEIVVRTIASLGRALGRKVEVRRQLRIGRFEVDLFEPGVRLDDKTVKLTLLEQTLLYLFLAHPGETLSRDEILGNIWGPVAPVTSNVIDRHIRDLRVKLQERWREPRFIQTVPGEGYRWIGDGAGGGD